MAATKPKYECEIFHLSASEIVFAGVQEDWPDGGGWYYHEKFPNGEQYYGGPFCTEDDARKCSGQGGHK